MVFSGAIGVKLAATSNSEFEARNVTSMNQCTVGLEVHFKEAEGNRNGKNKTRLRRNRSVTVCIGICIKCKAEQLL